MALTQITNPTPVVTPAIAAQTYNLLFVSNLNVRLTPQGKVVATATVTPYYNDANGYPVFSPTGSRTFIVQDLFAAEAVDANLSAAMNAVMTQIQSWVQSPPSYVIVR